MKSVKLGRLRINLDHLVWYSPSGKDGAKDPSEEPAISLKTTDSPAALSIRYPTIQKRDADLALLDQLFDVSGSAPVIDHAEIAAPAQDAAGDPAPPAGPQRGRKKAAAATSKKSKSGKS